MMMVMMATAALAVMVVMLVLILIIVVIMVVVMVAAFVAVVIIVVIIMVVVMVAALVAVLIMVMVVVMMMLFLILVRMGSIGSLCFAQKLGNQVALTIHNGNDLCTGQFVPIGGHNGGGGVLFLDQGNGCGYLLLVCAAGAAQDDAGCVADLVIIELAKVLHIHLTLFTSATVTKLFRLTGRVSPTPSTARVTSLSLPTPEGSIRMRSG